MANYRVLSTDLSVRCPSGKEHVENASISVGMGHNQIVSGADLHTMETKGDNFVVVVTMKNELDWPSGHFDECACHQGYILRTGLSVIELTQQAIDNN